MSLYRLCSLTSILYYSYNIIFFFNSTKIDLNQNIDISNPENEFIVDKTLIFKSFDVSSYVLNKMYEESLSFLKFGLTSFQIQVVHRR